jgi:hypothetical protein
MEVSKYDCPSTRVGGPRQQNHHAMNVQILSNTKFDGRLSRNMQNKSKMKRRLSIK